MLATRSRPPVLYLHVVTAPDPVPAGTAPSAGLPKLLITSADVTSPHAATLGDGDAITAKVGAGERDGDGGGTPPVPGFGLMRNAAAATTTTIVARPATRRLVPVMLGNLHRTGRARSCCMD